MPHAAAEIDRLWDEAMAALDRSDADAAEAIGAQLRDLGHSSCFEVVALARLQRGDARGAATILEKGVSAAPGVWPLWNLLGNARSDLGDYDGARAAYTSGLGCTGANRAALELNLAIVDWRQGRLEGALQRLDTVERLATEDEEALGSARKARLGILRERRGRTSAAAHAWRLTVQVRLGDVAFLQVLDVVADDASQALGFIKEDLGAGYADAVLESATEGVPAPDARLGVYQALGRVYFDPG